MGGGQASSAAAAPLEYRRKTAIDGLIFYLGLPQAGDGTSQVLLFNDITSRSERDLAGLAAGHLGDGRWSPVQLKANLCFDDRSPH